MLPYSSKLVCNFCCITKRSEGLIEEVYIIIVHVYIDPCQQTVEYISLGYSILVVKVPMMHASSLCSVAFSIHPNINYIYGMAHSPVFPFLIHALQANQPPPAICNHYKYMQCSISSPAKLHTRHVDWPNKLFMIILIMYKAWAWSKIYSYSYFE